MQSTANYRNAVPADRAGLAFAHWLTTVPGQYLLDWEQSELDRTVADIFGYRALQLGRPELDGLSSNRMPSRWIALDEAGRLASETWRSGRPQHLDCDFTALPFASDEVDLVVLPHTLELAADPHQVLREVERVLLPEGRLVILGFNPASLWGLRRRLIWRAGADEAPPRVPDAGEWFAYWRVRDWLRLLNFEIEGGRFGCYRPPLRTAAWLNRCGWMDRIGDRWWPVLGSAYCITAIKRVRGMRMVGLAPGAGVRRAAQAPVVVNRQVRGMDGDA